MNFGDVARLVDIFKMITQSLDKLAEEEAKEAQLAVEKRQQLQAVTEECHTKVGGTMEVVAAAATQLQANAKHLLEIANMTNEKANLVSNITGRATGIMQTIAAASEELTVSIGEINCQVSDSTRIAQEGVAEVKRNDATFTTLSDSASQIGDVVKHIQDIAGQTNLLALNATIEAALCRRSRERLCCSGQRSEDAGKPDGKGHGRHIEKDYYRADRLCRSHQCHPQYR